MLIEVVQELVDVEVIGFLIYDQPRQVLEGKLPFVGLPPQFVEMYQTEIVPQGPAEKILMQQEVISVPNAADNFQWENLGLIHLAQAASLKDSVLVPLSAGGRCWDIFKHPITAAAAEISMIRKSGFFPWRRLKRP